MTQRGAGGCLAAMNQLASRSLSALAGLAVASLLVFSITAHAEGMHGLMVTDGWSRETTANARVGGGYLTIMNHGEQADRLLSEDRALEAYADAATNAKAWLSTQDGALQTAVSIFHRIRELAISAGNALGDDAREGIAVELEGIREELVGIANTKFNGRAVFGGFGDQAVADSGGTIAFVGDTGVEIVTGDGSTRPLGGTYLISAVDAEAGTVALKTVQQEPLVTRGTFTDATRVSTYRMTGADYFYFFAWMVLTAGVVFSVVARFYRERQFIQSLDDAERIPDTQR